ncbi:MAG: lipoyl(octanoyl) transferase LipB [Thermoplasmataceae archaeon]
MANRSISSPAIDLGLCDYTEALGVQKRFVDMVKKGEIEKALIFVTHPPVYTIGRKADPGNYPGIQPIVTERGGDITFHGPGQLVVYPILRVGGDRPDVRKFVGDIQEIVERTLQRHGYMTARSTEPGIWVVSGGSSKKVASVGLALDHFISYHGVAINISAESLPGFNKIKPCGLDPSVMGYVEIDRRDLMNGLIESFSERYGPFQAMDAEGIVARIKP